MNSQKEIHVSIGEVKVGHGEDILKTNLGSCVGILLSWKRKKIYGLAHCLLAECPNSTSGINARFVSQAIPSLIKLMNIKTPEDFREVEAVLIGGGNMIALKKSYQNDSIGDLNAKTAKEYLKKYGIKIVHQDLGGENGRNIRVQCETGAFDIQKIPRIELSQRL